MLDKQYKITFNKNFVLLELILDKEDYIKIINIPWKLSIEEKYPYYIKNKNKRDIFFEIFSMKSDNIKFLFKNGNEMDLRKENIEYFHKYDDTIREKYNVINYIQGHCKKSGIDAYILKNPIWQIEEDKYIMYCEKNQEVILDKKALDNLKEYEEKNNLKLTFYHSDGGYIYTNPCNYLIRQIIYGNENIKNIKYIDKNPLNNSYSNLIEEKEVIEEKKEKKKKIKVVDDNHYYDNIIRQKYNIISYSNGHYKTIGKDAYVLKNPIWQIEEDKYIMYCEKNKEVILDKKALDNLKDYEEKNNLKLTFFYSECGYIYCSPGNYSMHQIIMDFYGNGKGTKDLSIDHIDRNPLNNSFSNLRIVSRDEQEQNSKGVMENTKRARKKSAKPLPDGLTQEMMPKYVVYYRDFADKEKTRERQYFKIEKHPKLEKIYISSKSNNKTLMEKLQEVKDILHKLDNDIPIISPEKPYPAGLRIKDGFMIFDKKIDDKRCNMRGKMNSSKSEEENITEFMKKVNEKYGLT